MRTPVGILFVRNGNAGRTFNIKNIMRHKPISIMRLKFVLKAAKCTAWKVSKYGVLSGSYFPVFFCIRTEYESLRYKSPYSVRIVSVRTLKSETSFGNWKPFHENAFYFTLKTLFILKVFKFLSWRFGHAEKHLE